MQCSSTWLTGIYKITSYKCSIKGQGDVVGNISRKDNKRL